MRKNWEVKKLGDLVSIKTGKLDSNAMVEGGAYPFFTCSREIFSIDKYAFDCEAILLAGNNASGDFNVKHYSGRFNAYQRTYVITINNENEILYSYLKHHLINHLKQFKEQSVGANTKFLKLGMIQNVHIPLPNLSEQHHVVSILDEAFAAIAKAIANAEKNLKNAKEFYERYLQGVFENKDESWVNTTIGETCNLQTGGTPSTSKKEYYQGGTIKWLVSGDINQKVINDCEGRITELGLNSSNTKYLPVNSVLIALNGQGKTRGTVAMLKTKATCNQSLVSIFPKDEKSLLPELLFSNLEGRYEEIRKITGDSGLNMPLIRSIKFSYPKKLSEQEEIIKKLDALSTETKKLEAIYQQKLNDLEEIKKAILQKAFSGELTSQLVLA